MSGFSIPQALTLLILLSALVVAHEWGHFIVARLFKIRVDDFSIGFGKRLLRIGKLGDTEYNIRLLPLGGFVKIAGMDPDEEPITRVKDKVAERIKKGDLDSTQIPLVAENTGEGVPYDGPDGFNSKPLWQRSLVILAGPVASFAAGVIILCLIGCTVGDHTGKMLNRVVIVDANGEGHRIGLRAGDSIIAINDVATPTGELMVDTIHNSVGKPLVLTIDRDGRVFKRTATPRPLMNEKTHKPVLYYDVKDPGGLAAFGLQSGDTLYGLTDGDTPLKLSGAVDDGSTDEPGFEKALVKLAGKRITLAAERDHVDKNLKGIVPATIASAPPVLSGHPIGVLQFVPGSAVERMSFRRSVANGLNFTASVFVSMYNLIKTRQLHKEAGGIVAMYEYTGIMMRNGPPEVLRLAAQISISLGIFNLLPIPVLDGGHLLSFFIEWVRRGKKMGPRLQQAFLMTGLLIIAFLFVLITGHDIWKVITHKFEQ